ncbi:glycoside hydrolase family 172 protein [Sphingomonas sp. DT-207]|uniref:glycoside hydrolase family 172 protein n=1 Tax=Sphingomonas sp. DT-207 TaxID=3396167 RepID=UPI003F1D4987
MSVLRYASIAFALLGTAPVMAQESTVPLYQFQQDGRPRWASPENREAKKGAGGHENKGGKGHAFDTLPAGASLTLADIRGAGVIDRMWITTEDRSPEMLRGLRLDIYWDGASTPAVSVPLGDFFGAGAGALVPMETALVASPEGRSYVSYVPMPFRTGARVVVTNESGKQLNLIFWDVNYRQLKSAPADALYFHAHWSRVRATEIGRDFQVLPRVEGRGRFLGTIVTTLTDPAYGNSWWGEGEAKIYLDGDGALPTLVGTGTEDYIGTGWGQGAYVNRFQGSFVADEPRGRWTYYRFHVPDPIFFDRDIRVDLQQIGGAPKERVIEMLKTGVKLTPVTIDPGQRTNFQQLLSSGRRVTDPGVPAGWTNFYRSDDVSAVAFFYLDKPVSGLSPLAPPAERLAALRPPAPPEKKAAEPGNPGQ